MAKKPKPTFERHPQAIDWDAWFRSPEGEQFCIGPTQGEYLRNRLNRAFAAGWDAAEKRYNKPRAAE